METVHGAISKIRHEFGEEHSIRFSGVKRNEQHRLNAYFTLYRDTKDALDPYVTFDDLMRQVKDNGAFIVNATISGRIGEHSVAYFAELEVPLCW